MRNLTIKSSLLGLIALSFFYCNKKYLNEELDECDPVSNLYEDGTHYIRRELVTDEGVLDYHKLLESSKQKNSRCYPIKKD
ncbi:MAG: hypothetical protein L6Q54_03840 [Leptospiraceae bacterium]|nr:hypothetical protein [Leptospiraceae bacterium]MCK6380367.1 hypothetical protein [Leptospiraceae bacterium]NUM41296.1 hypothetical protein [Leptospiraceae bacterium]